MSSPQFETDAVGFITNVGTMEVVIPENEPGDIAFKVPPGNVTRKPAVLVISFSVWLESNKNFALDGSVYPWRQPLPPGGVAPPPVVPRRRDLAAEWEAGINSSSGGRNTTTNRPPPEDHPDTAFPRGKKTGDGGIGGKTSDGGTGGKTSAAKTSSESAQIQNTHEAIAQIQNAHEAAAQVRDTHEAIALLKLSSDEELLWAAYGTLQEYYFYPPPPHAINPRRDFFTDQSTVWSLVSGDLFVLGRGG